MVLKWPYDHVFVKQAPGPGQWVAKTHPKVSVLPVCVLIVCNLLSHQLDLICIPSYAQPFLKPMAIVLIDLVCQHTLTRVCDFRPGQGWLNCWDLSMSNSHIPSNFIKSVLQNGVGRYVCQLQRITLKFCKSSGNSKGLR